MCHWMTLENLDFEIAKFILWKKSQYFTFRLNIKLIDSCHSEEFELRIPSSTRKGKQKFHLLEKEKINRIKMNQRIKKKESNG